MEALASTSGPIAAPGLRYALRMPSRLSRLDGGLIGRANDLAAVDRALKRARGVSLIGPVGVGKSALARAFADRGPGPFIVVDAASARGKEELTRAIVAAAGIEANGSLAEAARQWAARGVTVLLDDARADHAEVIDALLAAAPTLHVVVTSRGPVGFAGESTVSIAPLSLDDAAALFAAAAGTANASSREVRAIVERLDALPLAIVLAAARADVLSLDAILARTDAPLALLRARVAGIRHESFEAALDGVIAPLSPATKEALACAAALAGSFDAELFELAMGDESGEPLDALVEVLHAGLLERSVAVSGEVRFRMPQVVRAFVASRLSLPDARRYERWESAVLEIAERHAAATYGASTSRALDALVALAPDVLRAFDGACEARPANAARLLLTLFDVVLFREVIPLGDVRFDRAIVAADAAGEPVLRVRTRILRARVRLELGPPDQAAPDLDAALAMAGEDAALVSEVRRSRAWKELGIGAPSAALVEIEAALAASVLVRDARGHGDALAAQGLAEIFLGARARGVESLELARAIHVGQRDALRADRVGDMLRLVAAPGAEGTEGASPDDLRRDETLLVAAAAEHEARGQGWRAALDHALLADLRARRGDADGARAARLLARASARVAGLGAVERALDESARAEDSAAATSPPAWRIADGARAVVRPDGTRLDLVRHGSLRRVLVALVTSHREASGHAMSAEAVLAAGWPGERVLHEAGMLRVYSAIRRLRRLGLADVLVTRDDGYLLDPKVAFVVED